MRFSERQGFKQVKSSIQLDSIDQDLRNALWDHFVLYIFKRGFHFHTFGLHTDVNLEQWVRPYLTNLWHNLLKESIDTCPIDDYDRLYRDLRVRILEGRWLDVYDLVDFTSQYFKDDKFDENINQVLERELSGFRLIEHVLCPITDNKQTEAIESALKATSKMSGINKHLQTALEMLSDRKAPDHRNSIKEAISAVEGICQIIAKDPKAELSRALKVVETKMPIHEALKRTFLSMYGYTSDSDEIRHAMLYLSTLHLEDSLYFLVVCSAFISYLLSKCERYKIPLKM